MTFLLTLSTNTKPVSILYMFKSTHQTFQHQNMHIVISNKQFNALLSNYFLIKKTTSIAYFIKFVFVTVTSYYMSAPVSLSEQKLDVP